MIYYIANYGVEDKVLAPAGNYKSEYIYSKLLDVDNSVLFVSPSVWKRCGTMRNRRIPFAERGKLVKLLGIKILQIKFDPMMIFASNVLCFFFLISNLESKTDRIVHYNSSRLNLSVLFAAMMKICIVFDSLSTGGWNIQSTLFSEFLNTEIENQIFGAGYGSSRKLMYDYSGRSISAHSVYLQVLVDFGWFGLTFFCFLLVSLLFKHRYSALVFAIASFSLGRPFTLPFLALFILSPAEVTGRRLPFCSSSYPKKIASTKI